jgi:hypothetical protein
MARSAALLLVVVLALFVPARPAAAQNFGCELGALPLPNTLRALLGVPWTDSRRVLLGAIPLDVRMCTPMDDSATGARMLQLTVDALPQLDALTDIELRGSVERTIVMISSQEVYSLGADGFIDEHNVIHLHPRSLPSTVVHEAAHYWASREHFADAWLVEAYAEHLTGLAMPYLGYTYEGHDDRGTCADFALLDWRPGLPGREVCAYSVGPQVLRDLAGAVGEDTLRRVIGQLGNQSRGVESWNLLVALEAASGKDLSAVMRGRVFPAEYDAALSRRSAARARLAEAAALAARLGQPTPGFIAGLIDRQQLPDAELALDALVPLLASAAAVSQRCQELQLPCAQPWQDLGEDVARWRALAEELERGRPLLDGYASVRGQAAALGIAVPADLQAAAASLSSAALPAVQEAADTLGAAQALEQQCGRFPGLACRSFWVASWDAGDRAGAQLQIRKLDRFLGFAAAVDERCGARVPACRAIWRRALAEDGLDAAPQALVDLTGLLDQADQAEQACADASWPCPTTWRAHLERGDLAAAVGQLAAQTQALPALRQVEQQLDALAEPATTLENVLPADWRPATRLTAARAAFAQGDLAGARSLAEGAVEQRLSLRRGVRWGGALLGLAVVALGVVVIGVVVRRRPAARAPGAAQPTAAPAPASAGDRPADDLLERLLRDPLDPPAA